MNGKTAMEAAVLSDLHKGHLDPFERAAHMYRFLVERGWRLDREDRRTPAPQTASCRCTCSTIGDAP